MNHEPNSRADFIEYCLAKLGKPVINIELSPQQSDFAVTDALTMFRQYHYDATMRTYLVHTITQDDLDNHWIPCQDNVVSVIRVLKDDADNLSIFDIRYQLRLQDFYNFSNVSMQHYQITMDKMRLIDWMLNPEPTISFERLANRIYLNADWSHRIQFGQKLIFEVYEWLGEEDYPRIWHDIWLKRYATALMKKNWGSNLKKFQGIQMLGSVQLTGQQIYDEAIREIDDLEKSLVNDYQIPARIFIG